MANFLILGLIPGTNLQIDFLLWITLVAVFISAILVGYERRKRVLRSFIIRSSSSRLFVGFSRHNTLPVQLEFFQ